MTMRDSKKGPIFDKFKEGVKNINRKLIRNKKAQEIKKAAKGLNFRNSEARDMAKRYRRNELSAFELGEIQNKLQVDVGHTTVKDESKKRTYHLGDFAGLNNMSNQDEAGNTYDEQKQGWSSKYVPVNKPNKPNKPLVNPIAKKDDNN